MIDDKEPVNGLCASLAEENFTLTYNVLEKSLYSPDVLTISNGKLISIPYAKNSIISKGLPINGHAKDTKNKYRAHNTKLWGSTGCITAQKGNPKGDFTTVINTLKSWGVREYIDIPCSFDLGVQ